MRKLIHLVVFLVSITFVVAQPGHTPPSFMIDYSEPQKYNCFPAHTMLRDSLVNNYNFSADVFAKGDTIRFTKKSSIKHPYLHHDYSFGKKRNKRKIAYTRLFVQDFWRFGRFVPKGSLLGLSLEHKKTKQVMNIFVRLGEPLSTRRHNKIYIYGLAFEEGDFFYDLCHCKYTSKPSYERMVYVGNRRKNSIKRDELQQLLNGASCSSKRFLIDLGASDITKETFLKNYDVLAAKLNNQIRFYHYKRKGRLTPSFLKWEIKKHPYISYFPYRTFTKEQSIIGISFINDQKQAMNLYFKIYKRYEDYNRNQITLTRFRFVEGNFFYDMENIQLDNCSKPHFIDEFDLSQVTKYAVSKQELEQILKNQ